MTISSTNFLTSVSHWGVKPDHTPAFAKRIILTNLLGMLYAINMAISALAFLYLHLYYLALFTLFFVLTEFSWPLLNRCGHYNFSRVGLLISSNLLGFTVSILLAGTGYNHGFFVMAGLPILLFSLQEKRSIVLGFILPLVLYPFSEWAQYQVTPIDGLALTPLTRDIINYSINTIYVTLTFLMFLFLSRENARSEEKLQQALLKVEAEKNTVEGLMVELEEQRARSFSTAKFAALGEMASGIGHEINNPMTVINLNLENLKYDLNNQNSSKEIINEKIDVIGRTVKRVARIIEAMRAFSREASKDSMQDEPLSRIVEDTLTFCSERFKNHKVKLEVSLEPSLRLHCRSVQISQVLLNLLNNAFDAVEMLPEKWIKLEAKQLNDRVIIAVTDSGSGISPAEKEKIFQPFYTTKPPGKGTGLGLSLSAKIIQDHGAKLELDSESANTRFVITFEA